MAMPSAVGSVVMHTKEQQSGRDVRSRSTAALEEQLSCAAFVRFELLGGPGIILRRLQC
jgi:hypothetical protein